LSELTKRVAFGVPAAVVALAIVFAGGAALEATPPSAISGVRSLDWFRWRSMRAIWATWSRVWCISRWC
jgi:hypothetical protein